MDHGLSQRQAGSLMGISRRALTMAPAPDKDAALRDRLRSVWRANMGYRMAHAYVKDEFAPINVKRVHRI